MSESTLTETNPIYGPFFGVMGAASAMIFSGNFLICREMYTLILVKVVKILLVQKMICELRVMSCSLIRKFYVTTSIPINLKFLLIV